MPANTIWQQAQGLFGKSQMAWIVDCGSYSYPIKWNHERGAKPQALRAHLSTHSVGIPNHLKGQVGRARWERQWGTSMFPYCRHSSQLSPAQGGEKGDHPRVLTKTEVRRGWTSHVSTDSYSICMWRHHTYSKAGLGLAKARRHITEETGLLNLSHFSKPLLICLNCASPPTKLHLKTCIDCSPQDLLSIWKWRDFFFFTCAV